jgi:hypothetical protein
MNFYGGGREIERMMVTQETQRIFRRVHASWRIITLRHAFLYCLGQLMLWLSLEFGGAPTLLLCSRRKRLQGK